MFWKHTWTEMYLGRGHVCLQHESLNTNMWPFLTALMLPAQSLCKAIQHDSASNGVLHISPHYPHFNTVIWSMEKYHKNFTLITSQFSLCKTSISTISNFHQVLNVVSFLPCDFPACEFYTPTFRNTVPSSQAGRYEGFSYLPACEDEESIQHDYILCMFHKINSTIFLLQH